MFLAFVTFQLAHRSNVIVHFGHTQTLWRSCVKTVELTSQHVQMTVCNDLLHGDPIANFQHTEGPNRAGASL